MWGTPVYRAVTVSTKNTAQLVNCFQPRTVVWCNTVVPALPKNYVPSRPTRCRLVPREFQWEGHGFPCLNYIYLIYDFKYHL